MNWLKDLQKKHKRPRRKPRHEESELIKTLYKWFCYTYPAYKHDFIRIEHSRAKNKIQQMILKQEGGQAGTSDIFIAVPFNGFHGLWVEVKTKTGKARDSQRIFGEARLDRGYYFGFGYGLEGCQQLITGYLMHVDND